MKGILGRKIGMTQVFKEDGRLVPVSVIEATPMVVVQVKTTDTDGYEAIQIGFGDIKESKVKKPMKGHYGKAGVDAKRNLVEFRVDNASEYEVGQVISVDTFKEGDFINVSGISKGKGTQGTIKRYNQSIGPKSHGSKFHRAAGSLGSSASPSRVFKGMHMAGRMGNEQVTVKNLQVVRVDMDRNLLLVKGAVPGPKKGIITIKESVKNGR
ncbi:MAG: 50S ribosomal protein L3 [Peptostreptococcaceae bacterium]|nr:50S ribosomal protein L3 [Peptostreptococcaceae bacterium]